LSTPEFFFDLGRSFRNEFSLIVWDVSDEEEQLVLLPERGWRMIVGMNMSSIWGEYERSLNGALIEDWINEKVLKDYQQSHFTGGNPLLEQKVNDRLKNARKKINEERKKKKEHAKKVEKWHKEWAQEEMDALKKKRVPTRTEGEEEETKFVEEEKKEGSSNNNVVDQKISSKSRKEKEEFGNSPSKEDL